MAAPPVLASELPIRRKFIYRAQSASNLLIGLLATVIALVSYRYVLGLPPVPDNIAANHFRTSWLALHAASASTALLVGAAQFTAVSRWGTPSIHRMTGRVYGLACLVGSFSGFVLAIGTSYGLPASLGFGLLAVAWTVTTAYGWKSAVRREFADHRRWMIRSWALTLSAVTLRLYLPLSAIAGLPDVPSYQAISFLCWVPNLILAEIILRSNAKFRPFADRR